MWNWAVGSLLYLKCLSNYSNWGWPGRLLWYPQRGGRAAFPSVWMVGHNLLSVVSLFPVRALTCMVLFRSLSQCFGHLPWVWDLFAERLRSRSITSLLLELSRDVHWWMWKGAWFCNIKAQEWKRTQKEALQRPSFHPGSMTFNTWRTNSYLWFSATDIDSCRLILPRSAWAVWGNPFIIQNHLMTPKFAWTLWYCTKGS